jgi:SNF family Na+-dependent transporter
LKALDTLDFWVGTFLIFVLATIQVIVFGWVWGIEKGFKELHQGGSIRVPWVFRPIVKWICPAFLIAVFVMWFLQNVIGVNFSGGATKLSGYVTDLYGSAANHAAQLSVALVIAIFIFFGLITSRSRAYKLAEQGKNKDS